MHEGSQAPILKCAISIKYTENEHQRAPIHRTESKEGILEKDFSTLVETKKTKLLMPPNCRPKHSNI